MIWWAFVIITSGGAFAFWALSYTWYPWKWVHKRHHPSPEYRETRTLSRCKHCHAEWVRKYLRG